MTSDFAEAKNTIRNSCYMDDCIDSRPTEDELHSLAVELPELLLRGGMKICKIYSNSPKALESLDPLLLAKEISFDEGETVYNDQKVLGMVYNAGPDCFTYNVKFSTIRDWKDSLCISTWTKRTVLRVTASHYDPLGFASPVTIQPRRFLQDLWQEKMGWDDPLSEALSRR